MPKQRNAELERAIKQAAWESFQAHGYDATTYSNLADKCGTSKGVVQYYFPKKEQLAFSFMEKVLEEQVEKIKEGGLDPTEELCQIGLAFFEFFLQSEGCRAFLLDIIRDRDLTQAVLAFDERWALGYLGINVEDSPKTLEAVIVLMGGFYELLYYSLKTDTPIDIEARLLHVVDGFATALRERE